MNQPEFIPSGAPHKIEVREGSHDAKIRSAALGTETRQLAIDSDEVANAIDAEKRRTASFGPETDPPQQASVDANAAPEPLVQADAPQLPEPVQAQAFAEPESDAPPTRTRARRPGGGAPSGPRPTFKFGLRSLFLPILLVLVLVGGPIIGLLTDARWFESLGAGALYWQRLQLQGGLFVGGTLAALALLMLSLAAAGFIARRLGGTPTNSDSPREPRTPLMDDRGNLQPDGIVDALRGLFGADGDGAARSAGATIGSGALRIGAVVVALLIGAQVAAN